MPLTQLNHVGKDEHAQILHTIGKLVAYVYSYRYGGLGSTTSNKQLHETAHAVHGYCNDIELSQASV